MSTHLRDAWAQRIEAAKPEEWKKLTRPVRCRLIEERTFVGRRSTGPEIGRVNYGIELKVRAGTEGLVLGWVKGEMIPGNHYDLENPGQYWRGKRKSKDFFMVQFPSITTQPTVRLSEEAIELLEPIPRRKTGAMQVKDETSPLDYHGHHPKRIAVYDQDAGDSSDHYFAEPGLVAFVDYEPVGAGNTFINYMATRGDYRGRGLARRLVQHLYDHTTGGMDWGEIHDDPAWTLFQDFRERYPDRNHRGKNRT